MGLRLRSTYCWAGACPACCELPLQGTIPMRALRHDLVQHSTVQHGCTPRARARMQAPAAAAAHLQPVFEEPLRAVVVVAHHLGEHRAVAVLRGHLLERPREALARPAPREARQQDHLLVGVQREEGVKLLAALDDADAVLGARRERLRLLDLYAARRARDTAAAAAAAA